MEIFGGLKELSDCEQEEAHILRRRMIELCGVQKMDVNKSFIVYGDSDGSLAFYMTGPIAPGHDLILRGIVENRE